jgi:hypothetical protein
MKLLKRIFLLLIVVVSFSSCTKSELEEEFNEIENTQSTGGDDYDILSEDSP